MQTPEKFPVLQTAFDSLTFLSTHNAVFRKYFFLPFIIMTVAQLLQDVPFLGPSALAIGTVMATTLATVSTSRFYRYQDPKRVSTGAQRAFGRLFFVVLIFTLFEVFIGTVVMINGPIIQLVPFLVFLAVWFHVKISFLYPALALDDHNGSVKDVLRASFHWSTGLWWRLFGLMLFSYGPMIFVFMGITSMAPGPEDAPINVVSLGLNAALTSFMQIFCTIWISISLTMLYEKFDFKKSPNAGL